MSRLIVATNNAGKTREIKAILGGYYDEILSLKEAGISLDVVEDGDTFEQNAVKKATEAAALTGCDTLADDSGLCVDALGGAPGVYSARYAGEDATDAQNNDKLLAAMQGVSGRGAKFVCVMALVRLGRVVTAYGEVCGEIAQQPAGSGGFGYDPLFYYPALGQTFGQLSADIKNSLSHRAGALAALKAKLAGDA
jgi:XTP/dITP diphosphohydrolase